MPGPLSMSQPSKIFWMLALFVSLYRILDWIGDGPPLPGPEVFPLGTSLILSYSSPGPVPDGVLVDGIPAEVRRGAREGRSFLEIPGLSPGNPFSVEVQFEGTSQSLGDFEVDPEPLDPTGFTLNDDGRIGIRVQTQMIADWSDGSIPPRVLPPGIRSLPRPKSQAWALRIHARGWSREIPIQKDEILRAWARSWSGVPRAYLAHDQGIPPGTFAAVASGYPWNALAAWIDQVLASGLDAEVKTELWNRWNDAFYIHSGERFLFQSDLPALPPGTLGSRSYLGALPPLVDPVKLAWSKSTAQEAHMTIDLYQEDQELDLPQKLLGLFQLSPPKVLPKTKALAVVLEIRNLGFHDYMRFSSHLNDKRGWRVDFPARLQHSSPDQSMFAVWLFPRELLPRQDFEPRVEIFRPKEAQDTGPVELVSVRIGGIPEASGEASDPKPSS